MNITKEASIFVDLYLQTGPKLPFNTFMVGGEGKRRGWGVPPLFLGFPKITLKRLILERLLKLVHISSILVVNKIYQFFL